MPASIGVNLRVTGHCSQGGRKYMEDFFSVAYQQSLSDERDLEYAFIGIYDGHGGSEAATFAKEHLINLIVNQKLFWSNDDRDVLRAIREGYIATHYAMWREQEKWPKTATGLPSTAGTTASVAFIRHGKIYIGHVGDSGIVLGYQEDGEKHWRAKPLTQDHKPECNVEKARIINSGGKVVTKSGVPRVVWNRPRLGHKGPVRRSTPIDEIPFLAVARSLGDLWSYNSALNEFVVSPEPDVRVVKIDPKRFRCLIFGTDGLWNVLSAQTAVDNVRLSELMNERNVCLGGSTKDWTNPSKNLVDRALERWSNRKMRADNTSVVIIMLDPPGPPKRDVLKTCSPQQYTLDYLTHADTDDDEHGDTFRTETGVAGDDSGDNFTMFDHRTNENIDLEDMPMPTSGLAIMTRAYETNAEVPYMNSFAESYNSLLNSSLEHDQSYIYNTGETEDVAAEIEDEDFSLPGNDNRYFSLAASNNGANNGRHRFPRADGSTHFAAVQQQQAMTIDTYRLTKLQTRSEQQIDMFSGETSSSSSSSESSVASVASAHHVASTSSYQNYFEAVQQQQSTVTHKKPMSGMSTSDLLFQQSAAIDAYRLQHQPQTIQHYPAMSSATYAIPCASTSNFRLPNVTAAAMAEQPLPAMETILHNLQNSTSYYAADVHSRDAYKRASDCSGPDESRDGIAVDCVTIAVDCVTGNCTFQPDYEPEIEEEMSTVDLTISPATIEDLAAMGNVISAGSATVAAVATDDSIQINEISSSEAMEDEEGRNIDQIESFVAPPREPTPARTSPTPPKSAAAPSIDVPIERIMTRSSQAQSPRITRSTDKRVMTKQSEKKRRQVALKAKIDAIIEKRSSTANNATAVAGDHSASTNKFHKENISNIRRLRKQLAAPETTSVVNVIRTRNASVRIPSPATVATSTSNAMSRQRTLRSQNTVTREKTAQASTSRTDTHQPNDASSTTAGSAVTGATSKHHFNNKSNSAALGKQQPSLNNGSGRSNGQCSNATKLKTNVQQFLSTRQLRDAKLAALNNVSTILAKKSLAVLPSRCSNGSSFLGDVERTMITRRTRLHH